MYIYSLIDISNDGDCRLFINANGNYALANSIKNGFYGNDIFGYINYPEQAEVMICKPNIISFVSSEKVDLNTKVEYKRISNINWRMKKIF